MKKLTEKHKAMLEEINEHRVALGYKPFKAWPAKDAEALVDLYGLLVKVAPFGEDTFDLDGQGRHTGRDQWKFLLK